MAASTDLTLLRGTVSDILGQQGTAAADTASATGATDTALGASAEQTAYGQAQTLANQNAGLEEMSGRIQELQTQRQVQQTIGEQRAQIAAAGFGKSGTALDLLRASTQQGNLADQLIRTQTAMNVGGFNAQAAAAQGEGAAAGFASNAATNLAAAYSSAATTATTNAANETAALMGYLVSTGELSGTPANPTVGPNLSPTTAVELSTLQGEPGVPNLATPQWQQNATGQWVYGGNLTSGIGANFPNIAGGGLSIGGGVRGVIGGPAQGISVPNLFQGGVPNVTAHNSFPLTA